MGYSDMDKKPFEPLTLIADGYDDVVSYIENNPSLKSIGDRTMKFLEGFYSDFSLELLSSVDYIINKEKTLDSDLIYGKLCGWNDRKRSMFDNKEYIELAVNKLKSITD